MYLYICKREVNKVPEKKPRLNYYCTAATLGSAFSIELPQPQGALGPHYIVPCQPIPHGPAPYLVQTGIAPMT